MENHSEGTRVTIKMPVSRWLKADERLAEAIKEIEKEIDSNKSLNVERALGETQHEILTSTIAEFKANLEKYVILQDERIRIRNEVARKNTQSGVNFKLARVSMLKQRSDMLKKVLREMNPDMMTPEEFKEAVEKRRVARIKPGKKKTPSYDDDWSELFGSASDNGYSSKKGLSIRILSFEEVDQCKSQIQRTELEIFELKSEIAESNGELLAIEMPLEVAGYFRKI